MFSFRVHDNLIRFPASTASTECIILSYIQLLILQTYAAPQSRNQVQTRVSFHCDKVLLLWKLFFTRRLSATTINFISRTNEHLARDYDDKFITKSPLVSKSQCEKRLTAVTIKPRLLVKQLNLVIACFWVMNQSYQSAKKQELNSILQVCQLAITSCSYLLYAANGGLFLQSSKSLPLVLTNQ